MKLSKKTILLHVLFWVGYTTIFTIVEGGYNSRFDRAFYIELAHLPLRLIVVYLNILIFFPRLLLKGKYLSYGLVTAMSLLMASLAQRAIMFYYVVPMLYPSTSDTVYFFIPYKILQAGVIINSPLIFMLGFSVLHHVFRLREKTEILEREKLQSELKFLKSQLNPHFFFNTLNSLYGLTQERSDRAPEVVLKLAELMSFVIYESDMEKLPLGTELKYIRNYIELEEVRYGSRFTCNLSIEGNTDVLVPPLVLLPFVENSFKHGIHQETDHGYINIKVHVKDEWLKFSIENSIADAMYTKLETAGGLGISNTKRRLDLLFPSGYILQHGKKGDKYIVKLEIKLITDK